METQIYRLKRLISIKSLLVSSSLLLVSACGSHSFSNVANVDEPSASVTEGDITIITSNSGRNSVDSLFNSSFYLGTKFYQWSSTINTNHGQFKFTMSAADLQVGQETIFGLGNVYTATTDQSNTNIMVQSRVIQLNSDPSQLFIQHNYIFKTDTTLTDATWFSADLVNNADAKIFYGPAADTYYMADYFALPIINGYQKSGDMLKGGTPLNYVWNASGGVAVAVLSEGAGSYQLPLSVDNDVVTLAVSYKPSASLQQKTAFLAGETLTSDWVMVNYHQGDYFQPLRRLSLAQEKISNREIVDVFAPKSAKAPYWKTWGINPDLDGKFTQNQIEGEILPLLKSINIDWVLLDWGWFDAEQNWHYNSDIFSSDDDIKAFISRLNDQGMHVGVWYQPVQVDLSSSEVLANQTIMDSLIFKADGEAYIDDDDLGLLDPSKSATTQIIKDNLDRFKSWGGELIYLDSQEAQLSSPPNYANTAPLSSYRALPSVYRTIQDYANANNMVIEICLDGRSQSLLNFPIHITNTGDPRNDRQARAEFKSLKAISGDNAVIAMYVDDFDDNPMSGSFMNVIGLGAKLETLFNVESYQERQTEWQEWMSFYYREDVVSGQYLDLYDIAFDYPEGHVVKKNDAYYYTFFTHYDGLFACLDNRCDDQNLLQMEKPKDDEYKGSIELRGLDSNTQYMVTTYPEGIDVDMFSDNRGNITVYGVTMTKELMYIVKAD